MRTNSGALVVRRCCLRLFALAEQESGGIVILRGANIGASWGLHPMLQDRLPPSSVTQSHVTSPVYSHGRPLTTYTCTNGESFEFNN